MKDPKRLAATGTDFEREVLASARLDVGSDRAAKRALVAISSAATLSATGATAGANIVGGSSASVDGVLAGGTLGVGAAGLGVATKWVGVAALIGLVGGGVGLSVSILRHRPPRQRVAVTTNRVDGRDAVERGPWRVTEKTSEPPSLLAGDPKSAIPAFASPTPAPPPAPLGNTSPPEGPGATTDIHVAPPERIARADFSGVSAPLSHSAVASGPMQVAPVPTAVSTTIPFRAASSSAPPREPSFLDDEVSSLDRIRAALAKGDPSTALIELDAYERSFPAGILTDEAVVLRVDALTAAGDRITAAGLIRRFLASNPHSPHASHLLELLGANHNP